MNETWYLESACLGKGSEMFFADSGDKRECLRKEAKAKNICRQCPVAAECLMYAMQNGEIYGIWGSFSPKERATLKTLLKDFNLNICKKLVNQEIRSIKAKLYRKEKI